MTNQTDELLFVYGTLMSGQRASGYLDGCTLLGRYTLPDFAMYDLGSYPGIVPQKGGSVIGEVYQIPAERLPELDAYEGEGNLYHRRTVTVIRRRAQDIKVQAYIYAHPEDLPAEPMHEPWNSFGSNRVWYAAYGSNLSAERFLHYIEGCKDQSAWSDCCLRDFHGGVFFGKESPRWDCGGVAFFDPQLPGETHMRLYKISRAQLDEVQDQEGPGWYGRLLKLGVHEDGCPIYTITSLYPHPRNAPSDRYLNRIRDALTKECGKAESEADAYLDTCRAN